MHEACCAGCEGEVFRRLDDQRAGEGADARDGEWDGCAVGCEEYAAGGIDGECPAEGDRGGCGVRVGRSDEPTTRDDDCIVLEIQTVLDCPADRRTRGLVPTVDSKRFESRQRQCIKDADRTIGKAKGHQVVAVAAGDRAAFVALR